MRTQNCKMFILDYRQARGAAGREDGGADHDEVSAAVAADPGAVPRHVQGAPPPRHLTLLLTVAANQPHVSQVDALELAATKEDEEGNSVPQPGRLQLR